jgi:K+-sensing histidine kinase KdpD
VISARGGDYFKPCQSECIGTGRAWFAQAESCKVLESDRLKTAILSSVSHELRTPLSTIKAAHPACAVRESAGIHPHVDLVAAIDDEAII